MARLRVGFVGIGLMGEPMAARLLAAGHEVVVTNRSRERVARLEVAGAKVVPSVADAVAGCGVVVTMLPRPADVEQVVLGAGGVLAHAAPGTVVLDCSTSDPELARRMAADGVARGVAVLDAPVSGGPAGAAAGALSVMVGGDAAALERVRPVLAAFAATVLHHGPAGSGQLAKLVNQTLVAGVTLAVCEAHTLAGRTGLDPALVLRSLGAGVAGSPLLEFLWTRLDAGDMAPGFPLEHFRKDLDLASGASTAPLPGLELVAEIAERADARVGGDRGTQALVAGLAP